MSDEPTQVNSRKFPTIPNGTLGRGTARPNPDGTWNLTIPIIPHGHFQCAMCLGVFPLGDESQAQAEAEAKGIDPKECGMVCDECYLKTPYGAEGQAHA